MTRETTSASNLHRRVICPGSHNAEMGLPETAGEYAEEGTKLHAALSSSDWGTNLTDADMELITTTQRLAEDVLARASKQLGIAEHELFTEGHERAMELRDGLRLVLTGHCDYWRYYPKRKILIIIDAKFGFVEVTPAAANLQLRAYATMGAQERTVAEAVVAICQPRAGMLEDAETITMAHYDAAALAMSETQIREWEKAWLAKDAPRIASEACRYCKAKLLCDAYTARFTDLATVANAVPASLADLPDEQFTPMLEKALLARTEAFGEALDQIIAQGRTRIIEGRIPGFRLKPNAARRKITDDVRAAELLASVLEFSAEEVAAVSSVSLGEAAKVHKRRAKVTEAQAKADVRAALSKVIEVSTPEPSIVPEETEALA